MSFCENISDYLAAGSAFVSAIAACFAYFQVEKSRKHSAAVTLSPHFHNIQDLIYYLRHWSGFSQDIINQKKESISVLRNFLCDDAELMGVLDKIDPWPNRQTVMIEEEKILKSIMKKYLQMHK